MNGGQGMVQAWKVTVDDVNQNPANYLATYHVPIGTIFPWGEFGQVALNYMVGQRLQSLTWVVWVYYGTPLSIPGAPWRILMRGALQSEESVYDADMQEIRFPIYLSKEKYDGLTDEEKEERPLASNALSYTTLITGRRIGLYQTKGTVLKSVSMDLPVTTLSLVGTTSYIADTARPYANSVRGFVNETNFYNGAPGTIKFESFEVDVRPGVDPGLSQTGILVDVALNFVENTYGWDKILRHEYEDEKTGFATPIEATGTVSTPLLMSDPEYTVPPQITLVKRALRTDFYDLLAQFGL